MTLQVHARHTYDSDDRFDDDILVGDDGNRGHLLVFDGPDGYETCLRFNLVEVSKIEITLYWQPRASSRIEVGSIEGDPHCHGDVGEWFANADPTHDGDVAGPESDENGGAVGFG